MTNTCLRVVGDDDCLLSAIQRRTAPWRDFERSFTPFLTAVARKLGRGLRASDADLDDVVQTACLKVIDSASPRFDPTRASASTYLYFIVRSALHVVIGRRRRREAPHTDADAAAGPSRRFTSSEDFQEPANDADTRDFIRHLFANVPDDDCVLFCDHAVNDRTCQDLSDERGVARSTISRKLDALQALLRGRAAVALAV